MWEFGPCVGHFFIPTFGHICATNPFINLDWQVFLHIDMKAYMKTDSAADGGAQRGS